MYPPEDSSDQSSELLLAELIREQVLNRTRQEIPHSVEVAVGEVTQREDGLFTVRAEIWAETESQKGILIGKRGAKISEIGSAARTLARARARRPASTSTSASACAATGAATRTSSTASASSSPTPVPWCSKPSSRPPFRGEAEDRVEGIGCLSLSGVPIFAG